jgi:hypothetical protein
MRMEVGVPWGRLNFHMNPHLWLVDVVWSAWVFVLSLASYVAETHRVRDNCPHCSLHSTDIKLKVAQDLSFTS